MPFRRNQKQEPNFQQVGFLVTRNISVFCLWRVALYFKVMSNSTDFYKRIFLHVIPAPIIVPCMIGHFSKSSWQLKTIYDNDFLKYAPSYMFKRFRKLPTLLKLYRYFPSMMGTFSKGSWQLNPWEQLPQKSSIIDVWKVHKSAFETIQALSEIYRLEKSFYFHFNSFLVSFCIALHSKRICGFNNYFFYRNIATFWERCGCFKTNKNVLSQADISRNTTCQR